MESAGRARWLVAAGADGELSAHLTGWLTVTTGPVPESLPAPISVNHVGFNYIADRSQSRCTPGVLGHAWIVPVP